MKADAEFELSICKLFVKNGFWALNIPKNKFGAQPFDVIAVRGHEIWAIDCKLCSTGRLALSRIEDNQWLSFEMIKARSEAVCGFVCGYKEDVYFIPVEQAVEARGNAASIALTEELRFERI